MSNPSGEEIESRIGSARERFESSWKSNTPLTIEDLLKEFSDEESDSAVRELLAVELEIRAQRGDTFRKEDYLRRLPRHQRVIAELFGQLDGDASEFENEPDSGLLDTVSETGERVVAETGPSIPTGAFPKAIGKYRVIEPLDRGGQATVYRAIHDELGRDVVIKFCHLANSATGQPSSALQDEGRVLASLQHKNLAQVFDFGVHDGRAYLVIEYIKGLNLSQYRRQVPRDSKRWTSIIRQVAEALSYVHERGVLHLDVKPQNILIEEDGTPRLIDFGLARAENAWDRSGPNPQLVSGTLAFMAPEQARGESDRVGPESDLFGLGAVMYFMVTGHPPIRGDRFAELFENAKACRWDPEALTGKCDAPMRSLIEATLSERPEDRPKSGRELASRLPTEGRGSVLKRSALMGTLLLAAIAVYSGSVPDGEVESGEMRIRVTSEVTTEPTDLQDVGSVRPGDRIVIRADVPAGVHVTVFQFDTTGKLNLIEQVNPKEEAFTYRYPADDGVIMAGPTGTEFLFLCGSTSRALTADDVGGTGLFESMKPFPGLPENAVMQIRSGNVIELSKGRAFAGIGEMKDPQEEVRDRLRSLWRKLESKADFVEGIAFPVFEQ